MLMINYPNSSCLTLFVEFLSKFLQNVLHLKGYELHEVVCLPKLNIRFTSLLSQCSSRCLSNILYALRLDALNALFRDDIAILYTLVYSLLPHNTVKLVYAMLLYFLLFIFLTTFLSLYIYIITLVFPCFIQWESL